MSCVRPTASWAVAALVSPTGPRSPMFSPYADQTTPAAVSRAPRSGSPGHWWESPQPPAIVILCADALLSRLAVIVSGGRPAAERAWLMSASTCAASVPGETPAESVADAVGDGVAGLADADAVGVGRADRFAGADDRFGEAAEGTLAMAAWKGRPAHEPSAAEAPAAEASAAEPQVAGVCRAVTFPGAGRPGPTGPLAGG